MFPIIPQYYVQESNFLEANKNPSRKIPELNELEEKEEKVKINKKVIVPSIIFPSCVSSDIQLEDLFPVENRSKQEVRLNLCKDGTIVCLPPRSWSWLRTLTLATDCHSMNLKLCLGSTRFSFVLQTVKRIQPSDILTLWFSHELLSILQIPFLLPTNIRGEKQYVCHKCNFQCEMPNPLKIHLALDCDRHSKQELWNRLKSHQLNLTLLKIPFGPNFTFQFSPASLDRSESNENSRTRTNNKLITNDITHPGIKLISNHEKIITSMENNNLKNNNSAFKPYVNSEKYNNHQFWLPVKKEPNNLVKIESSTISANSVFSAAEMMYSSMERIAPSLNYGGTSLSQEEAANILNEQAAQMETLVSNLGRIKDGHLCIYCGKMYSRKYGLKIHIRTHTGFKPLKCKYCNRAFGDPSNLNKHVRLHSEAGDTPYKCELCGKVLVRKRDLERHMKSRHQF